jgi:hypothetical protein
MHRAATVHAQPCHRIRAGGAIAIERAADALWRDGNWVDWSPVEPYEQIDPEPGTPQA